MIEKQLITALSPLIDDLTAIEKRLDEIAKTEGPAGPAGEQGPPGEAGISPEAPEVADLIKSDEAFIEAIGEGCVLETVRTGVSGIARGEKVLSL